MMLVARVFFYAILASDRSDKRARRDAEFPRSSVISSSFDRVQPSSARMAEAAAVFAILI